MMKLRPFFVSVAILALATPAPDCWALTQHHLGAEDLWPKSDDRQHALLDSEMYIGRGLGTIQDRELAARNYTAVNQFRTAAELFPDTSAGQATAAQCDRLRNYQPRNWVRR